MNFISKISNEEILKLPLYEFSGKVVVIDSLNLYYKYLDDILSEKYLGFDTETKPCFKKGKTNNTKASLLQLATNNSTYLIRINKITMPQEIIKCFSNNEHLKIGVSIKDDLRVMMKISNFEPQGFIELQEYVKAFGIEDMSLKKLAAIVLGYRISKSQQLSNWEATSLSEKQIKYAATDAWVCREIYIKLKEYDQTRNEL